jgi:hypothetical protein
MLNSYILKSVLIGTMVLLIFGIFNLPYGFYNLLRDLVFWSSIYILYKVKDIQENHIFIFIILFIISIIIFNPIIKLELSKGLWTIIDITYALIYGVFYLYCIKHDYI